MFAQRGQISIGCFQPIPTKITSGIRHRNYCTGDGAYQRELPLGIEHVNHWKCFAGGAEA